MKVDKNELKNKSDEEILQVMEQNRDMVFDLLRQYSKFPQRGDILEVHEHELNMLAWVAHQTAQAPMETKYMVELISAIVDTAYLMGYEAGKNEHD